MHAEHLPPLKTLIKESGLRIVLELRGSPVNAEAVRFLRRCRRDDMSLLARRIKDWITKEQEGSN